MSERAEDRHLVPTTCRRVVMICKITSFDEILENFTKFLIGKKWLKGLFSNVLMFVMSHVLMFVTCKLYNWSIFPTCQCVVHTFFMFQIALLHSSHSHETSLDRLSLIQLLYKSSKSGCENFSLQKSLKWSLSTDLESVPVKPFHQKISHLVDAAAVWVGTMRQDTNGHKCTHLDFTLWLANLTSNIIYEPQSWPIKNTWHGTSKNQTTNDDSKHPIHIFSP
jgi:hypothetical protein